MDTRKTASANISEPEKLEKIAAEYGVETEGKSDREIAEELAWEIIEDFDMQCQYPQTWKAPISLISDGLNMERHNATLEIQMDEDMVEGRSIRQSLLTQTQRQDDERSRDMALLSWFNKII